jgi:hypothetical protein
MRFSKPILPLSFSCLVDSYSTRNPLSFNVIYYILGWPDSRWAATPEHTFPPCHPMMYLLLCCLYHTSVLSCDGVSDCLQSDLSFDNATPTQEDEKSWLIRGDSWGPPQLWTHLSAFGVTFSVEAYIGSSTRGNCCSLIIISGSRRLTGWQPLPYNESSANLANSCCVSIGGMIYFLIFSNQMESRELQ